MVSAGKGSKKSTSRAPAGTAAGKKRANGSSAKRSKGTGSGSRGGGPGSHGSSGHGGGRTGRRSPAESNWHEPVSNESAVREAAAAREVAQPSSRGRAESESGAESAGDVVKGGLNVPGYTRPEPGAGRSYGEAVLESAVEVADLRKLPDVGVASFGQIQLPVGEPVLETVIGDDDRVQITDTASFPWRVHCSLLITAADNTLYIGTGWFIGPRTLVTAGHCVYINNSGVPGRDGWVKSIRVMPGRNGSTLPYGSATSTSFRTVRGWSEHADPNFDYSAILLPTPDLGNQVGHLGFAVVPDDKLEASIVHISGYPGDKPSGTQWYHSRRVHSVNARKVFYDVDTYGGQSGSAVYRVVDQQLQAVAVHAYGVGAGSTVNSGTRITQDVYDNLVAWNG